MTVETSTRDAELELRLVGYCRIDSVRLANSHDKIRRRLVAHGRPSHSVLPSGPLRPVMDSLATRISTGPDVRGIARCH